MTTVLQVRARVSRWPERWLAVLLFAFYGAMSVNRHLMMQTTGYDLGIFEQAVRAYAEGRAPVSPLRGPGFSLLGDHFHPALAVLAPVYRLFPDAVTLLVAQSALLAVSAVPLTRLAVRRLGAPFGYVVGAGYGLSWGLLAAVDFDFHEVSLAVPLLAFAAVALVERRWGHAVAWSLPLVFVKEDLCLTVAAVGGYLFLQGQRRMGMAVVGVGLGAFALIVGVVIPAFAPDGSYGQGHNLGLSDVGPLDACLLVLDRLASPVNLLTLLALLAPTALLAAFSPIALLAAPTLLWRFTSANPFHAATGFHYDAVLMPIVFAALIHALQAHSRADRLPTTPRPPLRDRVCWHTGLRRLVVAATVVMAAFSVTTILDDRHWRADDRVHTARALIALIPEGTTVAASNHLAPQLTATHTVQLFPTYQGNPVDAEWLLVDTDFGEWPSPADDQARELATLEWTAYTRVREADGYVLLHRR
ncbi:DUF2079 domain-containing protein [Actinokineospora fastidiosa]|uniref:DUF2079 domain-containing protein n=1 Tax=Actinokineospora fastidiosa TaxID=1816 RepID=A0A918L6P4_9PSEU|nr:DUF2079 domain-containing protein [Actinokineospora fastidiosa]GGS14432.1 hypothetical protein GCM10010171_02890 [Actinokineospora fastidiosa]